mmetsp:Transcript_19387/g.43081  ORF Transcript_19387/g.43081 Transcript_19387/m.43081 type:complete len:474 (+) Transcript_19387:44-1465(+)
MMESNNNDEDEQRKREAEELQRMDANVKKAKGELDELTGLIHQLRAQRDDVDLQRAAVAAAPSTSTSSAADDSDTPSEDADDAEFLAEMSANLEEAAALLEEGGTIAADFRKTMDSVESYVNEFVANHPTMAGVAPSDIPKNRPSLVRNVYRGSVGGYSRRNLRLDLEYVLCSISDDIYNYLGGSRNENQLKLTPEVKEEIRIMLHNKYEDYGGKSGIDLDRIDVMIEYVYNEHVLPGIPIMSTLDFKRYGYAQCPISASEALEILADRWYIPPNESFPEGFLCPAACIFGWRTNTVLVGICCFVNHMRHSIRTNKFIPPEFKQQLNAMNFQLNLEEGAAKFERAYGAEKGSMETTIKAITALHRNRNSETADLRFVYHAYGVPSTTNPSVFRLPPLPNIKEPAFFSAEQLLARRHTYEAFLQQVNGIVFKLQPGERYKVIDPEKTRKPHYHHWIRLIPFIDWSIPFDRSTDY